MKPRIKLPDFFIILIALGVTVFSGYNAYVKPDDRPYILIRGQSAEWQYPIEAEEIIAVSGPLGDTIVRIEEKRAWVESSPCANQTCTAAGLLTRQGQWSACLPNNVIVLIKSGSSDDVSGGGGDIDAVVW